MSAVVNEATANEPQVSTLDEIRGVLTQIVQSKAFVPLALALAGVCAFFWPLVGQLVKLWIEDDHYSHGWIVPVITGFVLYKWWPNIKNIEVKPGYAALLVLAPSMYIAQAAMRGDQKLTASILFIASILCAIWFVAGWKWMLAVSLPVGYLAFALPVWIGMIDVYTYPLQLYSTKIAYHILNFVGQQPQMDSMHPTDIYLSNFQMNVAVPCSGMKLLLAILAFVSFFLMIAQLKWWAKGAMVLAIIPLCLVTNAIRISMIGMVGNQFGADAGHTFHDWSGYIALIFCFWVLFKFARSLGWTD